jgi:hypothetical protein
LRAFINNGGFVLVKIHNVFRFQNSALTAQKHLKK